jgi:hypothetical protein
MRRDVGPDDDIVAAVRAGKASMVLVLAPGRTPLSLAQATAALGPLAAEAAPARRINAVVVAQGADPAAIDAAVAFLESAASTTGQILTVS